ncbi:hypothetical protein [Mycoplasmopsis agassizii]|uniref:Uncharacterized protein n=1 Tax=Mycoplasmopsis agassizii TaxID=33922 RepID=A0ABX4H6Q6_9BACT|nr:hypothetical protein [Mycoplasmopsis agassizii]PAF55553.1 hypothetical protein CJF60_02665 [Mycoplasmopsis agassizii]SMC17863.1 hypothetical protein SAMN02745179_00536 [Mycoplasmopsis agassizii]
MAKEKKSDLAKELCDDIKEFAKKNDNLYAPIRNLQEQEDASAYDLSLRGKPKPKVSDPGGDGNGSGKDTKYATKDYVGKAISGLKEEVKGSVKEEVSQSETRMSQKIDDSEIRMSKKIDDSEARMSKKIDDSEARMTEKMSNFATKDYVDKALLKSEKRNKIYVKQAIKEAVDPIIAELAETRKENKENKKTLDKILGLIEELNKKK